MPTASTVAQNVSFLLTRAGPSRASALLAQTGASQPTLSRAIALLGRSVVRSGRGSRTTYALRRRIEGVGDEIALFDIQANGEPISCGTLVALAPEGFWFFADEHQNEATFSRDLPWFMDDLRPSGYLGALVPLRHPDLEAPKDVRLWNADHCLRFLAKFGADNLGSLVFGERALKLALARNALPRDSVPEQSKLESYAAISRDVALHGELGSTAGGEQPKFLATLTPSRTPVLVKFSPPRSSEVGRRWADILICEHVALDTLRDFGKPAAMSTLHEHDDRVLLEVERFDRLPTNGRRGVVSLAALDDAHCGCLGDWIESTQALHAASIIPLAAVEEARWRQRFGELTANDDMHRHNLSFFVENFAPVGLTPAYDTAPMLFRPRLGHASPLSATSFQPPIALPADKALWNSVLEAAREYWRRVVAEPRLSAEFRHLAQECYGVLA